MVVIAYMVDKDYCGKGSVQDAGMEMGKCIYKSAIGMPLMKKRRLQEIL
jgi:hypothetical protein